ncbi:hypothetical protein BGZ70_008993 [Mortierella alpina]|uniref:Uncharacterized protein n=1 Tax=Mortierella alpina TaxID=64518 RepID=A0A9P6J2P0_MORAP|nr:hypothetical protein BGZ70_008993 [Mortierella alpina]
MPHLAAGLLLLLSVTIATHAQLDNCGSQVAVTSEADLAAIAECTSFSGTLTVSGTSLSSVSLPALTSLTGSISVSSNAKLNVFSLDGLESSTGSISLFNNTILSAFNVPKLETINVLEVVTAPNLRQLPLPSVHTLNTLKVEDTGLDNSGALPWTTLQKVTDLGVSNNKFLKAIDMPSLTTVSGRFVIAANGLMEGKGPGSSLHLNNLTSVSNCTLRHLTEIEVPALTSVSASLAFDETNIKEITVPNLQTVGQTLSIVSNNLLSNISFAELTTIGGALLIANNTALTTIDGFEKLKDISGVLNVRGAFTTVSLPAVSTVQGGMSVLSSTNLSKVKANARGKIVCQGMVKSARPTNADGSEILESAAPGSLLVKAREQGSMWTALAVLSYVVYTIL